MSTERNMFQTGYNVAGSIVAALVAKGELGADKAGAALDGIAAHVAGQLATKDDPRQFSGGGSSSGGGGKSSITLESALAMKMKFGAFAKYTAPKDQGGVYVEAESKSLGEILAMPASETATYGYNKGGRAYIEYLASDMNNNSHTRRRAAIILAAGGQAPAPAAESPAEASAPAEASSTGGALWD